MIPLLIGLGVITAWTVVFNPIEQKIAKFIEARQGFVQPRPPYFAKVAVIVPCYKHAQFLRTTMQSIAAQTYRNIEAIFVNDCSPDDTQQVLEANAESVLKEIPFKILQLPANMGQSEAINIGIGYTDAEVIMILNDDDYLMHDAIEIAVAALRNNPDIYMVGGGRFTFVNDSDINITYATEVVNQPVVTEILYPEDVLWTERFLKDLRINHSSLTFFRSAWESIGGYITERGNRVWRSSDLDFELRMSALFSVGVLYYGSTPNQFQTGLVPLAWWRQGYSVDAGVWS